MAVSVFPWRTERSVGSESSGYRAGAAWPLEPATGFAFLLKPLVPTWQLTASSLFSKPSRPAAWEDTVNKTRLLKNGRSRARQGRAGGSAEGPCLLFVELGTCFLSECLAWTPRLQGKAAWFPVSSRAWKHHWGREKPLFFSLAKECHEDTMGFALSYPEGIPKFQDHICP